MMHVSATGRELIERNEGIRLRAYPDPATGGDPWTIGYGDTGPDVVPGLTITQEEADERLTRRLEQDFGLNVNEEIGDAPTTQGQFDAMVSLAYNIGNGGATHQHGHGGFDGSSVLRFHLAGDYERAAASFALWNKAAGRENKGLTRRRNEEAELYLSDAAVEEIAPVAAPEAPPIAALLTDNTSAVGHQKALGGGLAVQVTALFDKVQSMFTGIHMDAETMLLIAGIAVALVVWKLSSSHKVKT